MPLRHIVLDKISEADLTGLISLRDREGKEIEYKREWETNPQELLSDVASFANAGGGDILYGVECGTGPDGGIPVRLPGIANFEADKEELRLQNLAAAWVAPRLIGLQGRLVPLTSGGGVFVVRVRAGPRPPHMVKINGAERFYSRHSNGRYRLDVDEIRRMAVETEGAHVRLRDFRIERIDRIVRTEIGVALPCDNDLRSQRLLRYGPGSTKS